MTIYANGKSISLEHPVTVRELLAVQKVEMPEYVTVQINEEFIDRQEFDTLAVKDGDRVEFLYFMGGGAV